MDRIAGAADFTPAAIEALKAFPIEPVDLEAVSLSENASFRVVDRRDGAVYVLRLHRPWYHTHEELISERIWIRALTADGVSVPQPVLTRDDRDYVAVDVAHTGERRFAGMARWREGQLLLHVMRDAPEREAMTVSFHRLGAMTAHLHNQASAWTPPAGFVRHRLDADGLMGDMPFWGRFWEHAAVSPDESLLMQRTRDRLHRLLADLGDAASIFGMIHADMHPGNILVQGDDLAIIDFDDCGFGWHLYDIAIVFVHHQADPAFDALHRAFIDGYRTQRALSDEMVALLPTFRLIRNLAQIGWLHQRPEIESPDIRASIRRVVTRCETFLDGRL